MHNNKARRGNNGTCRSTLTGASIITGGMEELKPKGGVKTMNEGAGQPESKAMRGKMQR